MSIFKKPLFRAGKKREMPEGLWQKCPTCNSVLHNHSLSENLQVCEKCGHHFMMHSRERIALLCDAGSFEEIDADIKGNNPLGFPDYEQKISDYQEKSNLSEAIITGHCQLNGYPLYLAIMDFRFLGASMGSVVGEKITRTIEAATKAHAPILIISASGGARMHEGIISLMQMAKTSGALALHAQAKLPFISLLTHPTMGGVTASFATLGDIILAEPGCMIGFAGPRVVKETTHENLPPGFQTAEFMREHGLIDRIVARADMKETLGKLLGYMTREVKK